MVQQQAAILASPRRTRLRNGNKELEDQNYKKSKEFWEGQSANNNGVLLGFSMLDGEDIKFSRKVLDRYKHSLPAMNMALDCGAGIGRVTENLLSHYFEQTDLIEPAKNFLDEAKSKLKDLGKRRNGNKVRYYYQ